MLINSKPVISFTSSAAKYLKPLILETPGCIGFRLSITKKGCTGYSYLPELPLKITETDLHWIDKEHDFPVFVDRDVVSKIVDTMVDYEKKTMGQSQLVYHNPNTKQTCGCGESFSA